jgi:hypothetical protein
MIELGRRGAPSLPASRLRELPLQGEEGHGAIGGARALPSAEVGLGLWPDRDFLVSLLFSSIPAFLINFRFTAKRLARSGPGVKTVSQLSQRFRRQPVCAHVGLPDDDGNVKKGDHV